MFLLEKWKSVVLFFCVVFFGISMDTPLYSQNAPYSYSKLCNQNKINVLSSNLHSRHIKIYFLGDQISLIIPLKLFFAQNSTQIFHQKLFILDSVAEFLNCYSKVFVKVMVENNFYPSELNNSVLSQQQAQVIASYLHDKNTNTQLISASGNQDLASRKISDQQSREPKIIILTKRLS